MSWRVPRYNAHSSRRVYLTWKHPTPLDRGEKSGNLTSFSSTNGALRAVKRTKECDKLHDDLIRRRGKFPVTTRTVLRRVYLTWKHPTPLDGGKISGDLTDFSSTNWPLCAVKRNKEFVESHVDLTRCRGESPVTTSAVLHCVYLAWKHPTPLDRGDISGQSTSFSTTNTALRAVKGTEKPNKLHVDLTR